MSDGRKYYCICESNCKFETMTKEQILAAIAQAVETGSVGDVDTGFVSKVKELNTGSAVTFWVGTRAQYNAITEKAGNCIYIMTDDTTSEDIIATINAAATAATEAAAAAATAAETIEKAHEVANAAENTAAEAMETASAARETANIAESKAVEALAAANAAKGVDFTDYVTFWASSELSDYDGYSSFGVQPLLFMYNPITGIVHFSFNLIYDGDFSVGNCLAFEVKGLPYAPKNTKEVPVLSGGLAFSGYFSRNTNQDIDGDAVCKIYTEKNFKTKDDTTFSGWYYAGIAEG